MIVPIHDEVINKQLQHYSRLVVLTFEECLVLHCVAHAETHKLRERRDRDNKHKYFCSLKLSLI